MILEHFRAWVVVCMPLGILIFAIVSAFTECVQGLQYCLKEKKLLYGTRISRYDCPPRTDVSTIMRGQFDKKADKGSPTCLFQKE